MARTNNIGEIYIIHLHDSLGHAKHYVGFTTQLHKRLWHHRNNTGSNFLRVCNERGIAYTLCVRFTGTRLDERRLKDTNNTARYCPYCSEHPREFQVHDILPHEKQYRFCEL